MRDFQKRAADINRDNPQVLKLRRQVADLDARNKALRARLREMDDLLGKYAQVINELAADRERLHTTSAAHVIALPGRDNHR